MPKKSNKRILFETAYDEFKRSIFGRDGEVVFHRIPVIICRLLESHNCRDSHDAEYAVMSALYLVCEHPESDVSECSERVVGATPLVAVYFAGRLAGMKQQEIHEQKKARGE